MASEGWSIRKWLEDLGLPEYSDNFEHHAIADDILQWLTKEYFEDLGVTTVGDRRRLLNAIELLRPEANEPPCRKNIAASRKSSVRSLERSRSCRSHGRSFLAARSRAADGSPSSEMSSTPSCSRSRSIHDFVWMWGNRRVVIIGDSSARGLERIFRRRYYITTSWRFEIHS